MCPITPKLKVTFTTTQSVWLVCPNVNGIKVLFPILHDKSEIKPLSIMSGKMKEKRNEMKDQCTRGMVIPNLLVCACVDISSFGQN